MQFATTKNSCMKHPVKRHICKFMPKVNNGNSRKRHKTHQKLAITTLKLQHLYNVYAFLTNPK